MAARTDWTGSSAGVGSVDELLALGDEAFVRGAYLALLGREPDEGGLAAYLAQLRTGEDKARLVAILARSEDGRQHGAQLPGLQALLKAQADGPPPFFKRVLDGLLRRALQQPLEPAQRALRALDNRLWRLEQTLDQQSRAQERLAQELAQLAITLQMLRKGQGALTSAHAEDEQPQTSDAQVPPLVEALLRDLQRLPSRGPGLDDPPGRHATPD